MRFAVDIAPLGELADPLAIVRLAQAAESAGWDGLSIWDSLGVAMAAPAAEPFVALAGVAGATERLRLILSVAILPRRRPQLLAQSAATLDRLSGGRLVLGIGAGGDREDFRLFGEEEDRATRVARLDEGLPLVDAWLRGESVSHDGPAYRVEGASVGPRPIQAPRPPIWLGGARPGALRRSAAWDGWVGIIVSDDGQRLALTPDDIAERVARIQDERAALGRGEGAFDVALFADSRLLGQHTLEAYAEAGTTWWLESFSPMRGPEAELLAAIEAGPPS